MTVTASTIDTVTAVVLAGGRSRRMGGRDKGLLNINGAPMVEFIVRALRPQARSLLVNANRNLAQYQSICHCRIVPDIIEGFAGPLAGMASALQAMHTPLLLTVPCDSPCIAHDYARRMYWSLLEHNAAISVAQDGRRLQPVFALLRAELLPSLRDYLQQGHRKIDQWYAQHPMIEVDFSDYPEMFFNINTPEEHRLLARHLRKLGNVSH